MGFITAAGRAIDYGQLAGAAARAPGDFDRLKEFGVSRVPNGQAFVDQLKPAFENTADDIVLRDEKGYAQQAIEKQYGLNTDKANYVLDLARAKGGGAYTDDLQSRIDNELAPARKAKEKVAPAQRMAGTALEDLGVDISPDSKRKRSSDLDRVKLGDKDKRSFLAEEKLRIANDLVGGSNTRDELVDMLNADGVQTSPKVLDAYNNDDRMNAVHDMDADNYFVRPEFESPSFVGEGQFGRVTELAPGYVSKTQEPLVEFGGYQMSEDGSMSLKGNLIGRIYDYRDVIDDANQLNYLNKKHVTPKVENLIIDEDGSTEMIMKDLRTNYDTSQDYNDSIFNEYNDPNTSSKRRAQLLKDQSLYNVRQAQQEATAASAGIELLDRHQGNILINKMTKRPMQIDPSGRAISGIERDSVMAQQVVAGLENAGLTDEAEIFAGLITEAGQRGDGSAVHDLAQQGMSRLMKIKKVL